MASGKAIYEHALHQVVEHLAESPRDYPAWAAPLVAAHVAMCSILNELLDAPDIGRADLMSELLDIVAPAGVPMEGAMANHPDARL